MHKSNKRNSIINMSPTVIDSSIRRFDSSLLKTPIQTVPAINDDEAERLISRQSTSLIETSSIIADSETLKDCLKSFNENKINTENAWSMSLIDSFANLINKHHKSLNNFQVCGTTLEASAKIYVLRVDSVHRDVLRIQAGLTRQKLPNQRNENDDNMNDGDNENQSMVNGEVDEQNRDEAGAKRKPKRKCTRRLKSTVTKNKETLNAKLDTNPFIDPIFAKLNSFVGDISSSNHLLQNKLNSINGELRLDMDNKFWDNSEQNLTILADPIEYSYDNLQECEIPLFKSILDEMKDNNVLRPGQTGYIITDTPAEEDDKDESFGEKLSFDSTNIDVAFDINAEVEPVQDAANYIDVDMADLDAMSIDDHAALRRCKSLKRNPIMFEDLRPINSAPLEYSYRPLDDINQFWAGPSHWKFRKSRMSRLDAHRQSGLQQQQQLLQQQTLNAKTKKIRRLTKKVLNEQQEPIKFSMSEKCDHLCISIDSKQMTKLRTINVYKKWDPKLLKLPTDLQLDDNRFDNYVFAPGLPYIKRKPTNPTPDIESGSEDHPVDMVADDYMDADIGETNLPQDNMDLLTQNTTPHDISEIPTTYEGAPQQVTKIDLPFAKRSKVIDMKQLKKCCYKLIEKQSIATSQLDLPKIHTTGEPYKCGQATFKRIYEKLPRILSKNMEQALSPSIAFYSILHLANEYNLKLINDAKETFIIRQLDDNNDDG